MMKICMISYSQYEYDNRVHRYAESLVERGDSVDVVCLGADDQPRRGVLNGVAVYRIQTRAYDEKGPLSYLVRMLRFFFLSFLTCGVLHLRKKYDVLHFHNIPDFGVFCTLIPKFMGAKVVLDVHDLVPEFYQRKFALDGDHRIIRLLKWVEKISAVYADHVITVTSLWKDTLVARSVSESKCLVVLNAPDPKLFRRREPRKKQPSDVFRLVYHGNLTEIFGVDLAIRAMAIVRSQIPAVELQIYGQGKSVESLTRLTKELGLEDVVRFNRPVSRFEVPEILSQADVGIDPKRDGVLAGEGLSSKCMEYLAVGIPAVVSRIKAARTYYDDSMVRFFEPGDEKDLARRGVKLYRHPEKRKALVEGALRFNREHGWPRYEKVYFGILDALTERG